jgi:hypothetical protein
MTRNMKIIREEHQRMTLALCHICGIALDYDGYRDVKGLKGLVDELHGIAKNALPMSVTTKDYIKFMKDESERLAKDPKCVWPCVNCRRRYKGCPNIDLRDKKVQGPCSQYKK